MPTTNTPFAAMALEMLTHMLTFMSMSELLGFSSACKDHRTWVLQYLNRRIHNSLTVFISSPAALLDTMRFTSAVISGSFALAMFLPAAAVNWNIADLNIYTRDIHYNQLVLLLLRDGYKVNYGGYRAAPANYYNPAVKGIITLNKGNQSVEIIISRTDSSIRPIFYFHSTVMMNFLTADSLFVAYPRLISHRRGLTNPLSRWDSETTRIAVDKYRQRGYTITDGRYNENHICEKHVWCTEHTRTTHDKGCLQLQLDRPNTVTLAAIPRQTQLVVWFFGGKSCRVGAVFAEPYARFC
ncbi:hypothetical protein BJ138DRAFT_1118830 [Hygrophoropsis aurantiaca]|uniref:Uncharacterized protein n=1 Tax=Hygrophoropsis aurantiaca TaxID=72124 RepID=A0ACB7ZVJ4_9AGAM|nr:hypothetical protein BJ138DRAFT_1118830 [Hygrophoropsis aurantiaca]